MIGTFLVLVLSTLICSAQSSKQNVYIYFKTNAPKQYYYFDKDGFYKKIFEPQYSVVLTRTLKDLKNYAYIITEEVPTKDHELQFLSAYPKEKVLLFSFEPPFSQPRSQQRKFHHYYGRVFTWNDDFIDNKKCFKVRYPWSDPRPVIDTVIPFTEKKLCTFIGGYNVVDTKTCSNHLERHSIIEFFEQHHPHEFDLYGPSWEKFNFKCYRGIIARTGDYLGTKIETLKQYKFDLCYENCRNLRGYVSERIFNAFSAGCVPVYSGSSNVEDYVPKNCFINRNDFKSNQELYEFLSTMTEHEYEVYLANIQAYLASDAPWQLTTLHYIQHIQEVLGIRS